MNILYLCHRLPYPPDKGDKIRAFRQIERLARRHQVWCAGFVDRAADLGAVATLREMCVSVAAVPLGRAWAMARGALGAVTGRTVTESFYRHGEMIEWIGRWSRMVPFDVVVAFSSSMAPYALSASARRRVLDLCDLDSHKWLDYAADSDPPVSWLYGLEGRRLFKRERMWSREFDSTILISHAEVDLLGETVPHERMHVVTNGVDLPHRTRNHCAAAHCGHVIGFVGHMSYHPNVEAVCTFVEQCWPEILSVHPLARFRIVGSAPNRTVRRLASAPGVEVIGAVRDPQEELGRFDVSVAPLRIARGLQNKVLESMAAGVPVVLSSKAATGIAAHDGEHFLVADEPDRIIRTIHGLLADPSERQRIGLAARQYVARHHRWHEVLAQFELVVTGALRRDALRATITKKSVEREVPVSPVPASVSS